MSEELKTSALNYFEMFDSELDRNFCNFLKKSDKERELIFEKIKVEFDKINMSGADKEKYPCWSCSDALIAKLFEDASMGILSSGGHYLMRRFGDESKNEIGEMR